MRVHSMVRAAGGLIVAATVASFGLVGVASAAPSTPSFGDIDQAKKGSLIIHKHERQNGTNAVAEPDGSASISTPGIDGVKFTVFPVAGLDMTKPETWDMISTWSAPAYVDTVNASTIQLGTAPNVHGLDTAGKKEVTTAGGGLATVSDLPVGLYLVAETERPSNVVDIAQPFLVSIPFPDHGNTKGWLYDVNVYPKNGVGSIDKTVSEQTGLGLGSVASFPVTVSVPKLADNANFKYYIVHDPMDSRLKSLGVASVVLEDGTPVPAANYTATVTGQDVDLSFTQAGLTWLKAQAGKKITVTFKGVVDSLGNGVVTNQAFLYSDTDTSATPPVTPPVTPPANPPTPPESPIVHQNWGDLVISKIDSGDHATGLSGAKFEVYAAQDPYAADCSNAQSTGTALTVGSDVSFVTGADGKVKIAGLFVSDSKNAPVDATQRCYVLKEIQAPTGYVLPTGAAAFTPVAVKTGVTSGVDVTIENSKNNMPPLPLTGAAGLVVLTVAGVLLLSGALFLVIRRQTAHSGQ
ncbi:type-2 fimbrial major subunit [Bombiscardovia nodaiensis]|uniref:Type-2 fimbrial major subunit n=1 Tax=Bombiscardovia nodaiensis TaxID=2932181 RepID=A0ABM8B981_9BIFI|nr:type-2 fimbrial major subunit [Bombiscardovia nodaiensis]